MSKREQPGLQNTILEKLPDLCLLVIGDVILDRYIWGNVERTSPEAPVPVVNADEEHDIPGGAANVARNLVAAGVSVRLVGLIGNDLSGKKLRSLLTSEGINQDFMIVDGNRPTTLKTRVLSSGQQLLRIDNEKAHSPTPETIQHVTRNCRNAMKGVDGIIISDYAKGMLSKSVFEAILTEATKRNLRIFVDPKGKDFSRYSEVECLTPNLKEAADSTGIAITDSESLIKAGRKISRITRAKCVCITRGAEGAALFQRRRKPVFISGHKREVYDITGAGDTFIGYFGAGYFGGLSFSDAADLANHAASITVGKLGVATVSPEELLSLIRGETYVMKIQNLPGLLEIVRSLRSQAKKIVFTNGCFDLLHIGHIKFLEQARNLGDCLIVAINSDRSVKRIKGAPRPIISAHDRANILASLHYVDYVIIFDEDEPINLIRHIKPDILVKGKNLKPEEIVGRDIVLSFGGQVMRLPFLSKISTDQLIRSIRNE